KENRKSHEQCVDVYEPEIDCSLVVEQPAYWLIDHSQPKQKLVDSAGSSEDRQPDKRADDVAGPEGQEKQERKDHFATGRLKRKEVGNRIRDCERDQRRRHSNSKRLKK